ncbi:hypothetical protein [Pseudonocardia spinosispora]|uniref:hypothetical protein n=1 Tax=Pseudonocardia spinosispora TaxID=103441 RepID=UPI003CCB9119
MNAAWPTTTLVHLPIHASWLNQVEIYFSVSQRKAISPIDFADLDALADRILASQHRMSSMSSNGPNTRPPHRHLPTSIGAHTLTVRGGLRRHGFGSAR